MVTIDWKSGMEFEATPPSGAKFTMDSRADDEGEPHGPSPMETLLGAIAGCAGMDIISILEKKREKVTGYRIEIEGTRPPQGQYPRPFLTVTIRHIVTGEDLDPAAVARSVELSDTKYCSVMATLREGPQITSEWRIEDSVTA